MIASPMSDAHLLAGSRSERWLGKRCIMDEEITGESICSRANQGNDQRNASSSLSTQDSAEKTNPKKGTKRVGSVHGYIPSFHDRPSVEINTTKKQSDHEALAVVERILDTVSSGKGSHMEDVETEPSEKGTDFKYQHESGHEIRPISPLPEVLSMTEVSTAATRIDEPFSLLDAKTQDMNEDPLYWGGKRPMDTDDLSSASESSSSSSSSLCKKSRHDFGTNEDVAKKFAPHPDAIMSSGTTALQTRLPRGRKDEVWLSMFEALKHYKQIYGNCIVPRGYAANTRLASWVAEQRKQYKLLKDGRPSNITQVRVTLLNSIGFAWSAHEAAWKGHFENLKKYREKYGNCQVSVNCREYPKLGLWVKEQRRHYVLMKQEKKSHLTRARFEALNSLGFCWDAHESTWRERFNELQQYKDIHGDCMVPTKYADNQALGTWVHHQRRQLRLFQRGLESRLTPERVECLARIGLSFDLVVGGSEKGGMNFFLSENKEPVSNFQDQSSYVASEKLKTSFKNDHSNDDDHQWKCDTTAAALAVSMKSDGLSNLSRGFHHNDEPPSLDLKPTSVFKSEAQPHTERGQNMRESNGNTRDAIAQYVGSSSFSTITSEKPSNDIQNEPRFGEPSDVLSTYIQFKRSDSLGVAVSPQRGEGMIMSGNVGCSQQQPNATFNNVFFTQQQPSATYNNAFFVQQQQQQQPQQPPPRPNEIASQSPAAIIYRTEQSSAAAAVATTATVAAATSAVPTSAVPTAVAASCDALVEYQNLNSMSSISRNEGLTIPGGNDEMRLDSNGALLLHQQHQPNSFSPFNNNNWSNIGYYEGGQQLANNNNNYNLENEFGLTPSVGPTGDPRDDTFAPYPFFESADEQDEIMRYISSSLYGQSATQEFDSTDKSTGSGGFGQK